jgi:putative flavoprotein involved in K+ transport
VGAGASGQQISEELIDAGRRVYLSVGSHRPAYRRYRGRDWTWWQTTTGFFDRVVNDKLTADPGAVQTGAGGGHDLDLRKMAADGVTLLGHIRGVDGSALHMLPDLAANIRAGDDAIPHFTSIFDDYIAREGLDLPPEPPRPRFPDPREMDDPILELDLKAAGIRSIVWATGFRYAFDWLRLPVLDPAGRPVHQRGVTSCPGLYFLGLRRQYKVKSSFIMGVGEDAAHLAEQITGEG